MGNSKFEEAEIIIQKNVEKLIRRGGNGLPAQEISYAGSSFPCECV